MRYIRRARRVRATGDSSPTARAGAPDTTTDYGAATTSDAGIRRGTLSPVDHDVVKKAPLFAALDDEASTTLMASMTQTRLERRDVLFTEGHQGARLYVIREGKVKLGRRSADGRENLVAILGPG